MNIKDLIDQHVKFNPNEDRCEECERTLRQLLLESLQYLAEKDLNMKFELGTREESELCKELNEDATQFTGWLKGKMKAMGKNRHHNRVFVPIIVRHVNAIATIGFEAYIESLPYKHS